MIIKLIIYIFIYTTLTGCDGNNPMSSVCESNCFLEMDAQNLVIDDNGYYNIEYNNGSNQTFSTLRARTGSNDVYQKLMWISDTEVQAEEPGGGDRRAAVVHGLPRGGAVADPDGVRVPGRPGAGAREMPGRGG